MKLSFSDFWDKLVADDIWWDRMQYRHSRKDLKEVGNKAFDFLMTVPNRLDPPDVMYWRQIFAKEAGWAKDAAVRPQLQQVEVKPQPTPQDLEKNKPIPKSDPRYDAYLKLWRSEVDKFAVDHRMPKVSKKEAIEEGDWLPKKTAPYIPIDPYLFHLKEGIKKFSGKTYKGRITFSGFNHFNYGLVTVFAESKPDADSILKKAERYAKLKTI
jgi:hypothetical protein